MLLAVDVGNSNVTLGVFRGEELTQHWRLKTDRAHTADDWGMRCRNIVALAGLKPEELTGVVVASVVPSIDDSLRRMFEQYFGRKPLFVSATTNNGLEIAIDRPDEAGADRIANAVAAYHRLGGPCVSVDFGTAINFDVVSAKGELLGALFYPGLSLSAEALFQHTARLPQIDVAAPEKLIGSNTVGALESGLYYGTLDLVDGILGRLIAELGPETKVVGTGGQAQLILPASKYVTEIVENLTLEGLRLIWERNR